MGEPPEGHTRMCWQGALSRISGRPEIAGRPWPEQLDAARALYAGEGYCTCKPQNKGRRGRRQRFG